jgi:hypothetical protein
MQRIVLSILSISLIMHCVGCSNTAADRPKLSPVSGSVTYKGKPVEGAVVSFSAKGAPRVATGRTNTEGKFQLTTFNTNDGAPLGEHVVTITKPRGTTAPPMTVDTGGADYTKAMANAANASTTDTELPLDYSDPAKSGLVRSVTEAGPNEFAIELQ